MIERISLNLVSESGEFVRVEENNFGLEMRADSTIAVCFSEICKLQNQITDEEIRIAEKFTFCLNLKNFLEDYANDNRNNRNL